MMVTHRALVSQENLGSARASKDARAATFFLMLLTG
jgi:hypothetical protein